MNIFRELVDELKEENLLEETVIDPGQDESNTVNAKPKPAGSTENDVQNVTPTSVETEDQDTPELKTLERPEQPPEVDQSVPEFATDASERESLESESESGSDKGSFETETEQQSLDSESFSEIDQSESEPGAETESFEFESSHGGELFESQLEIEEESLESEAQQLVTSDVFHENLSELSGSADDPQSQDSVKPEAEEAPLEATEVAQEISKGERARNLEEEKKYYRQRAMDEVTGLQLVEHVLSGVEREQMKSTPKSFDDLAVKRALHDFLKVADEPSSPEHSKAEFQLMQETENWCSALSRRDRNISVAHLRRFCETTKPSLSSQALISLARFYRNSPYSESVRGKFDLVFTKLFSKEQGGDLRSVVFRNGELVKHVQELYADWSSIPLYSTDEDDSNLLLTALKFQDFISEARSTESFDELVRKDFFKRLKVFKENTNENFFAPIVVSAAIESNVAVGNRYVELIELERQRSAGTEFGDKYGVTYDNYISEATSKTIELVEMLRSKKPQQQQQPVTKSKPVDVEPVPNRVEHAVEIETDLKPKRFTVFGGANKWLIVATVVVLTVTAWLFLQGTIEFQDNPIKAANSAKAFSLSGTPIGEYIHSARISRDTMYGITRSSWEGLSLSEKQEILKKAVAIGAGNDFSKVHLLNSEGESVAFGTKSKVTVY